LLSFLIFAKPVYRLVQLANRDDTFSYILLIPFITAWLLYLQSKRPQVELLFSPRPALLFIAAALLAFFASSECVACSLKDHLAIQILSLVLLLVGGFVLTLGTAKARASSFPLAFLLLTVPVPDVVLDKAIYGLRAGSAEIADVLFNLSGVPVLREGFIFRLPRISIEVAQECSGIRSSLALFILALLVAQFSFRPFWKKLVFLAAGLGMMLVKNGIRIVSLTLLGNYVDPDFLYGNLHHRGGVVFFLIGLALLLPLYWYLRRGETGSAGFRGQAAEGLGAAENS